MAIVVVVIGVGVVVVVDVNDDDGANDHADDRVEHRYHNDNVQMFNNQ